MNSLMIFIIQYTMLLGMWYQIVLGREGEAHGGGKTHDSLIIMIVKFPCAIALHLFMYPEVRKGMGIMKFANN